MCLTIVLCVSLPYACGVTEDYQTFLPPYPRFPLATFPSPLERAERLEAALRAEGGFAVPGIYLKRDDVLSLGLGGNKIRNLEFLIGEALARGAANVVTVGRQQSNHCRLTAAACARAGLAAHLVFSGRRPAVLSGNLLLDDLLGAQLHFSDAEGSDWRARLAEDVGSELRAAGRRPYAIPVGGSDPRGALGHALAALELRDQFRAMDLELAAVVLATATGGTQAGLLAGLRTLRIGASVHGFAVAKGAPELSEDIAGIASAIRRDLHGPDLTRDDIIVDGSMLGGGYGVPTEAAASAIRLLARTEGVFADPVYTGKAVAGLLALIRSGRFEERETIAFIHTGGAPALFA